MLRAKHKSAPRYRKRAKELRRQFSPYEQSLWKELRVLNKTGSFKFRRQHPISPYIADFVCIEAKLIIELDGASHDSQQEYDQKRDAYLEWLGYKVMRFSNKELMSNRNDVVMTISAEAKKRTKNLPDHNPSPAKTKGLHAQTQVFASSPSRGEET